jgi:hypothetical protein
VVATGLVGGEVDALRSIFERFESLSRTASTGRSEEFFEA